VKRGWYTTSLFATARRYFMCVVGAGLQLMVRVSHFLWKRQRR
jgi:hypothetical protein